MMLDLRYFEKYREVIEDYDLFIKSLLNPVKYTIRVNTLFIDPDRLFEIMERKGFWLERISLHPKVYAGRILEMPTKHPGATTEHFLGLYYVQELSSMLPPIALNPEKGDIIVDMCAAPGSKTTQLAAMIENQGTIIAIDISQRRMKALVSNVQRMGASSVIVLRRDARDTRNIENIADKVLLDAPCSSESVIRKCVSPRLDEKTILKLARIQKSLVKAAHRILKDNGILVYSTCTFTPEENEEVVEYALKIGFRIENVDIPLKYRAGILEWRGKKYSEEVSKIARVYPHLDDTGGIVIARLRKVSE